MTVATFPEFWLRGPLEGVPPLLQPIAHSLLQTREDASRAGERLTVEQLCEKPGGAAPAGFHLRHIPGVIDRLFTYARGEALGAAQHATLRAESDPGDPPEEAEALVERLRAGIDRALAELRGIDEERLLEARKVGRKELPSTVLGLLFHAAEHAQRHTGQLIVTARVVGGSVHVSEE